MTQATARLPDFWRRRSLRFWLASGMAMAVLPLLACGIASHILLHRHVIDPLLAVAEQDRFVLRPLQTIQLDLGKMAEAVAALTPGEEGAFAARYAPLEREVTATFEQVEKHLDAGAQAVRSFATARARWQETIADINAYRARPAAPPATTGGPAIVDIDHDLNAIAAALDAVFRAVVAEFDAAHAEIRYFRDVAGYLFLLAIGVSLAFVAGGVLIINRSLVSSMETLAAAALDLSSGKDAPGVDIQIPPELVHVATAFNRMTDTIADQREALQRLADTDGLTGLLNRRVFDRWLDEEARRAARFGGSFALAMIDIDHFKRFNDSHGHPGGDEALRTVAGVIRATIREVDRAFRYGGEEIALILLDSDAARARATAERVRAAVAAAPVDLGDGRTAAVTVSLGVAAFPKDGDGAEALLKAADGALYAAKKQGRDRVVAA